MHQYAAVTARAIALNVTMLTVVLSASLTPANAASMNNLKLMCNGADIWHPGPHHCMGKCETELWKTAKLWDGIRNNPWSCPSLLQACTARCVTAKTVAQH
jgi:hypothetical protein